MTTRYEATMYGLSQEAVIGASKITRVTAPDFLIDAVMIHHGGELILQHPVTGRNITVRDEGDLGHATILEQGKEAVVVHQGRGNSRTSIEGLGTVEYQGKRMSL